MKIKKGGWSWLKFLFSCILLGFSAALLYAPLIYLVGDRLYKAQHHDSLDNLTGQVGFGLPLLIIGVTILRKGLKELFNHEK